MNKTKRETSRAIRFKRFANKPYAMFNSLHRVVSHGVITVSMIACAVPVKANAVISSDTIQARQLGDVEVTVGRAPLSETETAKLVTVIERDEILAAPAGSIQDLLEYAVGIDARQRGELGIQSDLSIRGGTFDQITVLLNGANITNPQTGHFNFDLPISLDDIIRIEILEGPAARVYGTSSFTGAINIITTTSTTKNKAEIRLSGGQHGLFDTSSKLSVSQGNFAHQLSGGIKHSDGYTTNTAFEAKNVFFQSSYDNQEDTRLDFQFGYSDKGYDANTFYSAKYPNQYERVRSFYSALKGTSSGRINFTPTLYWSRHYDRFELTHGNDKYNYHQSDVYGLNLNAHFYSPLGKSAFGAELRNEGVLSNNLGELMKSTVRVPFESGKLYTKSANRTNISYFLEHNFLFEQFTLSLGTMALYNTAFDNSLHFYPGVDGSYRFGDDITLYASWNTSMRMPTFTDLYYKSATNGGNPNLRPEESQAYEVGLKYQTPLLQGHLTSYYRQGTNLIDWVRVHPDSIWKSVNHTSINTFGVESSLRLSFSELLGKESLLQSMQLGYSWITQDKKSSYESQYAMDYLKYKLSASLDHKIWKGITARWQFRWQKREGTFAQISKGITTVKPYRAYSLVDVRINYSVRQWQFFGEINNLLNTTYYDLGNITQPGFWGRAGVKYSIQWK